MGLGLQQEALQEPRRGAAMSLYSRGASGSMPVPRSGVSTAADLDAEAWVLTDGGRAALAGRGRPGPAPRPADIARWRKLAPPRPWPRRSACRGCRARPRRSSRRASGCGWTRSASSRRPARPWPATRPPGSRVRWSSTCARGSAATTLALAERADVLAVDLDHGMCRRIAWNAGVYEVETAFYLAGRAAETFPIPPGAWVHIDPDRRATGRQRREAWSITSRAWTSSGASPFPGRSNQARPGQRLRDSFSARRSRSS